MQYNIICNGDSWVFGCEIVDPLLKAKYPPDMYVGEYDYKEENIDYRTERIWTTYLKDYLDCNTVNIAWPADDNKSILNRTVDYVTQEYLYTNRSTDDLIVIVGWSSPERNSWWWRDDEISGKFRLWVHYEHFANLDQKKFWKLYINYLWNPEEYITRHIMDNLTLQNFCIANNIKYLIYNSFYQIQDQHISSWNQDFTQLMNKMDKENYSIDDPVTKERKFKNFDWKQSWSLIKSPNYYNKDQPISSFNQFIQKNLKNPYIGLHPSPQAHKIWAQEIANYLKRNII